MVGFQKLSSNIPIAEHEINKVYLKCFVAQGIGLIRYNMFTLLASRDGNTRIYGPNFNPFYSKFYIG